MNFRKFSGITWIWTTPGYHHLGAESNKVSRKNFWRNLTICLNNIPYFINKIWNRRRIKKWKVPSCSWENFWFFRTKKFFFDFSSDFFDAFRKTHLNLKLKFYAKNHNNSKFFFDNLAVRISDNWQLVLNQSSIDFKAVNIRKV